MTDDLLRRLALSAGIQTRWMGNDGVEREVTAGSLQQVLQSLGFACETSPSVQASLKLLKEEARAPAPPALVTARVHEGQSIQLPIQDHARVRIEYEDGGGIELAAQYNDNGALIVPALDRTGYHRLMTGAINITLAVAPQRCYTIEDASQGQRIFGLTAQTYGLRHACNPDSGMGSGNFGSLGALAIHAAKSGADALGMSPAHALFSADLNHYSPYSPSNRQFLNVLLGDPAAAFNAARIHEAILHSGLSDEAQALERNELIDWPRTGAARLKLLRALYDQFKGKELAQTNHNLAQEFVSFRAKGGSALEQHALFEAIHAQQFSRDFTRWRWQRWAGGLGDAGSPDTAAFARQHADDVTFHVFAQWLAARSLAKAQSDARSAGMRIGLINDLAVGLNAGGSHSWSQPDDLLPGLSIGAPPDGLAPKGQNWGLTTFSPRALQRAGYAPFISMLRATMRHTGGLRIDHVMGMARLWLIPDGMEGSEGAYVTYPLEDLLRLVALESHRHKAIVIGEDLGTVPPGFREKLAANGMAGLRVLLFERNWDGWYRPEWYPHNAVAMTTTHDTATFAGWWRGRDIEVRAQCDQLAPGQTREDAREERANERSTIERAFVESGVAIPGQDSLAADHTEMVTSAIGFIAQSSSQFVLIPVEDLSGEIEQPNLPGTIDEHPNWRRRYPPVEDLMADINAIERLHSLRNRRKSDI